MSHPYDINSSIVIMETKQRSYYVCQNCQVEHIRWAGKCNSCDSWNTIVEVEHSSLGNGSSQAKLTPLSELNLEEENRISSGIKDLDQVLGGGIMTDALHLIAGEPGVGKSTLLLEIARHSKHLLYYFSGEESVSQIAKRAQRMGVENKQLYISRETNLLSICATIEKNKPPLAIIDSIQTVYQPNRAGGAGNFAQLREAAILLLETARKTSCSIFLSGHITKDGAVAGPRFLEHMVDVVLYFDSDRTNHYRLLRAVKNRFGPVGEVAVFEMHQKGLRTISELPLLLNRHPSPGAVHSLILGGSRPLPIEVQALVNKNQSIATPRRITEGLDNRRLILLVAVLEKYLKKLKLGECDIFVNLVGGFSSNDPALDLAQCATVLSSHLEIAMRANVACLGEVGLGGEIRPVERLTQRLRDLQNIGFSMVVVPKENEITPEMQPLMVADSQNPPKPKSSSNIKNNQNPSDLPNNSLQILPIRHITELLIKIQHGILS